MATYYCDLDEDYTDQDGSDNAANSYSGVGGLQAAIRGTGNATALTQTADPNQDILYVKGTGDLSRLVWMDIDQQVSGGGLNWALGDEVRNDNDGGGAAGDDWTGTICELDYGTNNDQILVELDSGYDYGDVNDADGIENTTQANEGNIDDSACKGLEIDTNEGSIHTGVPIFTIGVNASWTNDGTKAELDGNSYAANCVVTDDKDGFVFENIAVHAATGSGFAWTNTASINRWVFKNCDSYSNLESGWGPASGSTKNLLYPIFVGCRSYSNTQDGWTSKILYGHLAFCQAYSNGQQGFNTHIACSMYACISYSNTTTAGIYGADGCGYYHCVSDGDPSAFVFVSGVALVVACRLTNAANNEISVSSAYMADMWNFVDSGGAEWDNGIVDSNFRGSSTRSNTGSNGYEDQSNNIYNLLLGAGAFRTEVDMLGSNYARFNRGLPNVIIPRVRED